MTEPPPYSSVSGNKESDQGYPTAPGWQYPASSYGGYSQPMASGYGSYPPQSSMVNINSITCLVLVL